MVMSARPERISFFQGENRQLTFRIQLNNRPLNVQDAQDGSKYDIVLSIRKHVEDDSPIIAKIDGQFDKLYADSGIVSCTITPKDLAEPGIYQGQLKVKDPDGYVRKSEIFEVEVLPAVDKTVLLATVMRAQTGGGEDEHLAELTIT